MSATNDKRDKPSVWSRVLNWIREQGPEARHLPSSEEVALVAVIKELAAVEQVACDRWVVGLVAWHNLSEEAAIERTRDEIRSGGWAFTSTDLDMTVDSWLLFVAIPTPPVGSDTDVCSFLVEVQDAYEPMLPDAVMQVYRRDGMPPSSILARQKQMTVGDLK